MPQTVKMGIFVYQLSSTKEGKRCRCLNIKVSELHQRLHKKEISVTDLVNESYKRIGQVEDKVGAFLTLDEENARAKAKQFDEKLANG